MTMRYSKPPSNRQLKVAEEIRKIVAQIIVNEELFHPSLQNAILSISEVRISADLKMATLFFTHINGKREEITDALNAMTREVRHLMAQRIKMKYIPNLRFVHDDNIENAIRIDSLLQD